MFKILQMLNLDKDRCVLIGRAAFNQLLSLKPPAYLMTNDLDVICPDLSIANECSVLLLENGFKKNNAVFSHPNHCELDVLISDPSCPENVIGGFFNLPSLKTLWDSRKRHNGYLVPSIDALVADKLLHARENQGKDLESISVCFKSRPLYLDYFIRNVLPQQIPEDRETMLYSLYASLSDDEKAKNLIEYTIIGDLEDANPSRLKPDK
jgi:hypothetical protein